MTKGLTVAARVVVLGAFLGSAVPAWTQDLSRAARFQGGDTAQRLAILDQFKLPKPGTFDGQELSTVLTAALRDPDATVRLNGCYVLHARAMRLLSETAIRQGAVPATHVDEQRVMTSLRPALAGLLSDDAPTVRAACVSPIAILGREGAAGPQQRLDHATATLLAQRYTVESDGVVRRAIIHALARGRADVAIVRPVLVDAVRDTTGQARQMAIVGVGEYRLVEALPAIVTALDDPDRAIRLEAARAVGALGQDARSHTGTIVRRLGEETDAVVRLELERTLKALQNAR